MKTLIAGGTGLIGRRLARILNRDDNEIIILTREKKTSDIKNLKYVTWSATQNDTAWVKEAGNVDAVVNMSGRSISDKWNEQIKREIESSRIESTKSIVEGIRKMDEPPKVLINGSAIGYYGSRGDEILTEESPPGNDFFANLCINWENEAMKAKDIGIRVVVTRTSVVLDSSEGALPQIVAPLRRGLGSKLGPGTQWVSWIHSDDAANAIAHLLENDTEGPVNLTSMNPVINRDFMKSIARAIGKRAWIPAPAAVLRSTLGEMADYLLLASQRVSGEKLAKSGYSFKHPELDGALKSLFST